MVKRKVIPIGLVSFVLLVSIAFSVSAQAASISTEPASIAAEHGDTFTINVQVDPAGAYIYGAQYVLYFDSSILNASSQTQGTFLSQGGATTNVVANIINNTLGKLDYGEARMGVEQGVTNSGTLASITFEVIGTSGTSYFEFSDVKLVDSEGVEVQNVTTSPGSFAIKQAANLTPVSQPVINSIVVEKAHEMMEENPAGIILLDVSTKAEYKEEHIDMPGVVLKNIPKDELENRLGELDKTAEIIVYSKTGSRSKAASDILAQKGFEQVYNMLGGMDEWKKFRFTVFRPSMPTSAPTANVAEIEEGVATQIPAPTAKATEEQIATPKQTHPPAATKAPASTPKTPGFEAVFAITGLLAMAYVTYKRRVR